MPQKKSPEKTHVATPYHQGTEHRVQIGDYSVVIPEHMAFGINMQEAITISYRHYGKRIAIKKINQDGYTPSSNGRPEIGNDLDAPRQDIKEHRFCTLPPTKRQQYANA